MQVAFSPGSTFTAGPGHAPRYRSGTRPALCLPVRWQRAERSHPRVSTFDITGMGTWARKLTGVKGPVSLFAGSFEGTIDWTFDGKSGQKSF